MSYTQSSALPAHFQPQGRTLQQQDPNAHYQTPPGYVLVPISQLDASLQQQRPPVPAASINTPAPQLPPRPLSPNPLVQAQQASPAPPLTTTSSSEIRKPTVSFPTPKPLVFKTCHIDGTKDLVIPECASQSDNTGYETMYRKLDYTDRKNPHTIVYDRSTNPPRLAGSCIYHHYWSNNLTMSFPFLAEPWEFGEAFVSDVGTCKGRALEWQKVDDACLTNHKLDNQPQNPLFVLQCVETNGELVCRIVLDDMRSARIQCFVVFENQNRLDEMVVIAICMMQRMRIKTGKDGKALLSDKDWDKLEKFNKVAGGALNAAAGGGS